MQASSEIPPEDPTQEFEEMTTGPRIERRLHAREFVLKEAVIITEGGRVGCSVRNQHDHGAELRVDPEVQIPERFVVEIPADDATYRAVLRWRRKERLGVQFFSNSLKE